MSTFTDAGDHRLRATSSNSSDSSEKSSDSNPGVLARQANGPASEKDSQS